MALMLRRLGPVVLVLVAVLLPALRRTPTRQSSDADRRQDRLELVNARLQESGTRWSTLAERDSGALPALRTARPGAPIVQMRGFGARDSSPAARTLVGNLWTRLGPADSAVRVAVVIFNGDEYRKQLHFWWGYAGASIALDSTGARCVAFAPGFRQKNGNIDAGKQRLSAALAPCLLLAGFGLPGAGVRSWLNNTRYAAAGSTAWLDRNRSFIDGDGAAPWMTSYDYGDMEGGRSLLSGSVAFDIARALSPRYELGALGLRCTAGDPSACATTVLDSGVIARATRGLPPDLTYSQSLLERPTGWTLGTPRPPGEWWLSDLIRDQGRERFAKFWTSPAPIEPAFREAFGEDLGAWTQRWSVRQWDNSWFEKYRNSPRILGVTLKPSWTLLVLGWSGLTLMLTAWVARRRQAT